MNWKRTLRPATDLAWPVVKWCLLGAWVGMLSGSASALFLWSLDWATNTRGSHPWLLYFLPLAGIGIGLSYASFGKGAAGGNNLILDRIHDPRGAVIPFLMAPLVLIATVITHLFGGSAGREGTAVQMGGTLADMAVGPLRLSQADRRILIMTGISAGFGSVFGTPLAGAIFGLEVLTIGRVSYDGLIPCLVGSLVGDVVCRAWGIHHTVYSAATQYHLDFGLTGLMVLASALFAGASALFANLTHWIGGLGKTMRGAAWLKPLIGGVIVILLTLLVGNQNYNGLGIPLIQQSFAGNVPLFAFALKILFTAITLGAGFKGGEVTPLFCIGATLGSAFAILTHQDPALFAALGFVGVFSGAANTPIACTIMGIELFGGQLAVPLAISSVLSYVLSGHCGIYLSQRLSGEPISLREIHEAANKKAPASSSDAEAKPAS